MIQDYFKIAFKNLSRRKLRAWLTIIGIIISIATIFVLISLSIGLQNAVKEQFRILGADKFFIFPKAQAAGPGSDTSIILTEEDIKTIEKVQGVMRVAYSDVGNAELRFKDNIRYSQVVGVPLERADLYIETGAYKADEGALLKKGDIGKIMVGSQYKYNNFFLKPVSVRDKINVNGKIFEVRTVLQSLGNPSDDRLILMPLEDFKELFNITDRVDQIIVQVDSGENVKEVADRVGKRLRTFREVTEKTEDFYILTPEELLSSFGTILNIITGFLIGIAAISLIVGAIGIANTMFTSVLERTKEIGVMKSVGAKNKDILLIFLIESGLLGLVGGLIGILFGMITGKTIEYIAINNLGTNLLQVAFPIYLIIGCMTFSFLIGAVSGVYPAWRASKIKPVDALRYE